MNNNDYTFGGIKQIKVAEEDMSDLEVFAVIDQLDQSEGSIPIPQT